MPNEKSREAGFGIHAPRPFIRYLLLGLLVAGLVFALLAYGKGTFLKAGWKKVMPEQMATNSPQRAAASSAAASPAASAPVPANPAAGTAISAEDQAQKIWTDFEKTSWNEALQAWSDQHQEIPCKAFRGTIWGWDADRQWSHRCAQAEQPESARWSFYVFAVKEPLIPRLEQFEENTATLPEETLIAIQNSLQTRLTAQFGPGEDRTQKPVSAQAFSWPNLHWKSGDIEIQLFASEFDPQRRQGRLRLLAQHRTLLEALKEDERLKLIGAGAPWYEAGSEIDKQLAENLRSDFPDAAVMLMKQRPDTDPEELRKAIQQFQNQIRASQSGKQTGARAMVLAVPQANWKADEFYGALLKLLTSAKTSGADRKPVLIMAADRMARRLPWVVKNDKSHEGDWNEWRKQLAKHGVIYAENAMNSVDDFGGYTGALLTRVWSEFGDTAWGERAFLVLQRQGWDTSEDCSAGSDQFRNVVQRGLEFQQTHPHSGSLPEVELTVAQAYETWWSLSQAPPGEEDSDVVPANYQEDAETARQKAIQVYERLLQSASQSEEAAYARRVLPRLKLGVDTGQRRYYCSVSD